MYLLDSNIFIEAKNRYYAFDIAPSFWAFLDSALKRPDVRSIQMVYGEICHQADELSNWFKSLPDTSMFLDVSDAPTQANFAKIANDLASNPQYFSPGVTHFLGGADPWLAAKAKTMGATLVTHEAYQPACRKRVPLGNVCHDEGVPIMNTFEFMRAVGAAI